MKKLLIALSLFVALITFSSISSAGADAGTNSVNLEIKGPGQVNVEVTIPGSGEVESSFVCSDTCSFTAGDDRRVTLLAIPREQASFLRWDEFCVRSKDICSFTWDPGVTGEVINIQANFQFLNNKKPYLKKTKALTSRALMIKAGCGGTHECSLLLSGYLRGAKPKRINIEPIFFDLAAGEKRAVNIIAGSKNTAIRKAISKVAKKSARARLFIRLTDLATEKTQGMAINEKPRCCFDKPNKPSK